MLLGLSEQIWIIKKLKKIIMNNNEQSKGSSDENGCPKNEDKRRS